MIPEYDLFAPPPEQFVLETYTEDELKKVFGDAPAEPEPETIKLGPPSEPEQFHLIDPDPPWRKEWEGMPQFVQEDQTPIRSILVHFESQEDIRAFENLICQSVGESLKSVWYPEAEIGRMSDKRYADEGKSS